jgi:hypothetical protein
MADAIESWIRVRNLHTLLRILHSSTLTDDEKKHMFAAEEERMTIPLIALQFTNVRIDMRAPNDA